MPMTDRQLEAFIKYNKPSPPSAPKSSGRTTFDNLSFLGAVVALDVAVTFVGLLSQGQLKNSPSLNNTPVPPALVEPARTQPVAHAGRKIPFPSRIHLEVFDAWRTMHTDVFSISRRPIALAFADNPMNENMGRFNALPVPGDPDRTSLTKNAATGVLHASR